MTEKIGKLLDISGATASWLCAVHCLALPFLITLLPLVGLSFLLDETTERVFIVISILLATASLLPAYFRQHGKMRTILLAFSGIALLILTHLLFEESPFLKVTFLLSGAILISAAHIINRRLCLACENC